MDLTPLPHGAAQQEPLYPSGPEHGVAPLFGKEWLGAVVALHERVRADMPEKQRHFLLPRDEAYFRNLLSGKNGVVFGAFANAVLVGSVALVFAESFPAAHAAGTITCPDADNRLTKKHSKGRVAVVQSMGLTGAYMGRGHARLLLQAVVAEAKKRECAHVFAQVAKHNTLSWLRFMDQGFAIIAAWSSGHGRFLLRWLSPEERSRLALEKEGAERCVYGKSYAQVPGLLAALSAKLAEGKTAFLDSAPDCGGLTFFFSR